MLCDTGSWIFAMILHRLENLKNRTFFISNELQIKANSCDVRFIQKSRNVVLLQGITRVCTRTRHSRGVTYPSENRVSIQKPKTISLCRSSVSSRARRAPGVALSRTACHFSVRFKRFNSQIVFVGRAIVLHSFWRRWTGRLSLNPFYLRGSIINYFVRQMWLIIANHTLKIINW